MMPTAWPQFTFEMYFLSRSPKQYGLSALDIIQSFLALSYMQDLITYLRPINIPCHGLFILLIVSNFTKDPPCGSVHLSFAVNNKLKETDRSMYYLQSTAGMPLQYFRFILSFQFNGNSSHLIAMASLHFTKHMVKMRPTLTITSLHTHFVKSIYIYISITRHYFSFTLHVQTDQFLATFTSTSKAN